MAQWAQLGELELKHLEACLRLTAKVSVEASIRDDLGLCKSMDFPSILFSRSTWVDRAPGYHILLLISINGKPLPREAAEMLEHSALKSRSWEFLNLRASLRKDDSSKFDLSNEYSAIKIHLTHDSGSMLSQPSHNNKLQSGVAAADTRPPQGVVVASLLEVHFLIDISSIPSQGSQTKRRKMHKTKTMNKNGQYIENDGAKFEDLFSMEHISEARVEKIAAHVNEDQSQESGTKRSVNLSDIPPRGNTSGSTAPPYEAIKILVDAALRLSICDNPCRLTRGVKIISNDYRGKLATLAPTLWSPGYIQNVSSRSCFLPTISRAFSSICQNSKSATLKSKLNILHSTYCQEKFLFSEEKHRTSSTIDISSSIQSRHASVSTSLWGLLSSSTLDAEAPRRLRLLTDRQNQTGTVNQDTDDMLRDEEWFNIFDDIPFLDDHIYSANFVGRQYVELDNLFDASTHQANDQSVLPLK